MSSSEALGTTGASSCASEKRKDATDSSREGIRKIDESCTASEGEKILWLIGDADSESDTETRLTYPDSKVRTRKLPV